MMTQKRTGEQGATLRPSIGSLAIFAFVFGLGGSAAARSMEPGGTAVGVSVGPSFSLRTNLGTSAAYGSVALRAEYAFDSHLAAQLEGIGSFGRDLNLRIHAGPKWQLGAQDGPFAPVVLAQLLLGRFFNVLGADLQFYGVRLGAGAEYYALHNVKVTAVASIDLGTTAGERPAFASVLDILVGAAYAF